MLYDVSTVLSSARGVITGFMGDAMLLITPHRYSLSDLPAAACGALRAFGFRFDRAYLSRPFPTNGFNQSNTVLHGQGQKTMTAAAITVPC